jgi:dihydroneopterin aldolase
MADHLARTILERFGAPWVSLSIAKLEMIRGVRRLGVRIERGKRPA